MDQQEEKKNKTKNYATIANEIARNAKITLTCSQYNILLYLVSKIKRDDAPDTWYRVPFQELSAALCMDNSGTYYKLVKNDLKKLRDGRWCKAGNGEYLFSWLQNADYTDLVKVDDEGKMTTTGKLEISMVDKPEDIDEKKGSRWSGNIHYQFNAYIAQYLFHLTGNYTMIEIKQFVTFKHPRSIRLYMFLKSYIYKEKLENNEPIFVKKNIEELRKLMVYGTDKEYGSSVKFFNRDVIKPGVEEINTKTAEFHVDYVFEKDPYDKTYKVIKFTITKAGRAQAETARQKLEYIRKKRNTPE